MKKRIAKIIIGMVAIVLLFPKVAKAEYLEEIEVNLETESITEINLETESITELDLETEDLTAINLETKSVTEIILELQETDVLPIEDIQKAVITEPVESRARTTLVSYTNNVEGFVERLYNICFGRGSDQEGQAYWVNLLKTKQQTAAGVTWNFFNSPEYRGKNHSNPIFIDHLYQVMLNRAADTAGRNNWLGVLDSGLSRQYVVSGFINSVEFTNICNQYNVTKGSITLTENRDKNSNTTRFVQRMYETCLNRKGDVEGLNYWTGLLNSGVRTGADCMLNFFESTEYKNKNKSDEAYVADLYRALFDREADNGGKNHWLTQLSNGASRRFLLAGFVNSTEFTNICGNFKINRGNVSVTNNDRPNETVAFPNSTTSQVVNIFESYISYPYLWHGNTPNGWDCAGFVTWVASNHLGVEMGRCTNDIISYVKTRGVRNVLNGNSSTQYNNAVASGLVKPGDIIIYYWGDRTIHVAIALEDGYIISALSTRWNTHKQTFTESWAWSNNIDWNRYEIYRGVN